MFTSNATISKTQTVTATGTIGNLDLITDLDVQININHTSDSDLEVKLVGPDGTSVVLVSGAGGDGDNFTNTLFNDQSSTAIEEGSAPFSLTGGYRPVEALSKFNGKPIAGTWTLVVTDSETAANGTLVNWSIIFKSMRGLVGTGTTNIISSSVGPTASLAGLAAGPYNITLPVPARQVLSP